MGAAEDQVWQRARGGERARHHLGGGGAVRRGAVRAPHRAHQGHLAGEPLIS